MSTHALTNLKTGTHGANWIEATMLAVDRRRVFIAEDDPFTLRVLARCFDGKGYDVIAAPNARLLLDLMKTMPRPSPDSGDVLVTDVELPEVDGFSLVDELRSLGWTLPVVFISAQISSAVLAGVEEREGDSLLEKPFSLRELGETVDRLSA